MSKWCPTARYEDLVRWRDMVGIVDREWSDYDRDGLREGWHLVLFEGGLWKWGPPNEFERLSAEFLGMPNEDHFPNYGEPLTLWQQIPHEYDEYLTWDMDSGCVYCGLPESHPVHPSEEPV